MLYSENLDKLAPALAKAQAAMGGAVKDSDNPFFKSKYADLTSVWKACKEALHENGLSVIQSPINAPDGIGVTTMLLHNSGQYVMGEYAIGVKKKNDPQADGSSITYARRYALAAFVGVCPVDDDAEAAMFRGADRAKGKDPKKVTAKTQKTDGLTPDDAVALIDSIVKFGNGCTTVDELAQLWQDNIKQINLLPKGQLKDLTDYKDERKAELGGK